MTALLDAIRSKTDSALASGDLSPLETSETVVEQNGLRFIGALGRSPGPQGCGQSRRPGRCASTCRPGPMP